MIRNVDTYNIIFGSAFVLLLFNPFIITEVGFRLSYLAVIGIIYLYPKIYSQYTTRIWIIDQAWMIISVSIAAQIATFPLSLLYFHQFPNLFLLSNLIVIPGSNLILFCGTALLAVGTIPYVNDCLGWIFSKLLTALNQFIFYVDSMPIALISGISITMIEMVLIYALIFLLCWISEERRVKVIMLSLVVVFSLISYNAIESMQNAQQKKLVVYCVPGKHALAFIEGYKVKVHFDESLLRNENSMLFHVKHHWWSCGAALSDTIRYMQTPIGKLMHLAGTSILLIDSGFNSKSYILKNQLKVDWLVITHNSKLRLKNISKMVAFKEVIFDTSNPVWRTSYWKKDCKQLHVPYWDVAENGAYVIDLGNKSTLFNYPFLPAAQRGVGVIPINNFAIW